MKWSTHDDRLTAVLAAAGDGDLEKVRALLKDYPGLAASADRNGYAPLHKAADGGHTKVVEILLASGADVNAKTGDGWMALHCAAAFGHKDVAELLISHNADVNAKVNNGFTPLHWAARNGYLDVVRLLLACKANPDAKDYDDDKGRTPLHYAAMKGHKDVVELLRQERRGRTVGVVIPSGPTSSNVPGYASAWDLGQELMDDFVVERTLGEGGMGKVYLVRSKSAGSRFAVKRAKGFKETDRKNFLAELQTWIELPEHANLVPCRFFRTLGEEILIFAEYVEGGSLQDWIDDRRIYEGGVQEALKRILDIAIQMAWGLHCAHELGLIHQDVKPANVLVIPDGTTKIIDFGLARAKVAARENAQVNKQRSIMGTFRGMTEKFCSPEQANIYAEIQSGVPFEQLPKLTRQTDIWSWSVSVLEMFTGEAAWPVGQVAGEFLEQHLRQEEYDETVPVMPSQLADLLRKCFRSAPQDRPASLADVVDRLKTVYRKSIGASYSRVLVAVERVAPAKLGAKERCDASGAEWTDPRVWLEKALRAAGRYSWEADALVARRGVTRQGDLVGELAVFDEAKRIYARLVQEGRKDLETELALLCEEKALVHRTAADGPGAISEYDRVIEIRERLVNQERRGELADDLAAVYISKAVALNILGDINGSAALYDQAIAIRERLVNNEGRRELANGLAAVYTNKALAVSDLGEISAAIALYDQAIAIRERLVEQEGRHELADDLATVFLNKANVVLALGDNQGAVVLCDQAIAIWERLVNEDGRRELANNLATAYMNKSNAVRSMGDNHRALALYDQAAAIWERLVNQEGRRELTNELARVYVNKAGSVCALGDRLGAMALYDQAIAIWERLVNQEGRHELANDLATVYSNKAIALRDLGDNCGAVSLFDQAIAIRERLVNQQGHRELADDLAGIYVEKALAVGESGNKRGAVAVSDQAIAIWKRLVNEDGRHELAGDLAKIIAYRGDTLLALGEKVKGWHDMRSAQGMLKAQIASTGRADLKEVLAWLEQQMSNHPWQ